jgi:hypothetical protein
MKWVRGTGKCSAVVRCGSNGQRRLSSAARGTYTPRSKFRLEARLKRSTTSTPAVPHCFYFLSSKWSINRSHPEIWEWSAYTAFSGCQSRQWNVRICYLQDDDDGSWMDPARQGSAITPLLASPCMVSAAFLPGKALLAISSCT